MRFCLAIILDIIRFIVLPVQFQDREFCVPAEQLEERLEQTASYLNDQYSAQKEFAFDLAPVITLPKPTAYYGRNGEQEHDFYFYEAVISACRESKDAVDFSLYDNDGDGKVEGVILLCAGESEADGTSEDNIWPQQSFISYKAPAIVLNHKTIDCYASLTETCSTGVYAHEMGHILGLPDFYDVDGKASGGTTQGLWDSTSVMDNGSANDKGCTPPFFNAIERQILGLGEDSLLGQGHHTLEPVRSNSRLRADTDTPGRYILIECRDNASWDRFCGGQGLLVYLIDRSEGEMQKLWMANRINCIPGKEGARIIPALGDPQRTGDVFFPKPGRSSLSLLEYGINLSLRNIRINADGSAEFDSIEPLHRFSVSTFQDAAVVEWELDESIAGRSSCELEWQNADGQTGTATTQGSAYAIEGLEPNQSYTLTLAITDADGETHRTRTHFKTNNAYRGIRPFIYLNDSERNADGSFKPGAKLPLRVYNSRPCVKVDWYMNGRGISIGPDGYYHVSAGGELRAVIHYEDGSDEVLLKKINVR